MVKEKEIGVVTHYYDKAGVAVIELVGALKAGEMITMRRGDTQFSQEVSSMQIEHKQVDTAKRGTAIGLKVDQEVRPGTKVYRGELAEPVPA